MILSKLEKKSNPERVVNVKTNECGKYSAQARIQRVVNEDISDHDNHIVQGGRPFFEMFTSRASDSRFSFRCHDNPNAATKFSTKVARFLNRTELIQNRK
jgi:hypothetical protein